MAKPAGRTIIFVLLLILLSAGVVLTLGWVHPQPSLQTTEYTKGKPATHAGQNQQGALSKPEALSSPVPKPGDIPGELVNTLSDPMTSSPTAAMNELMALASKPKHAAMADQLRWLIYQSGQGEVIRNQALVVLGAWDVEWLTNDLERMMFDMGQTAIWRAYCVQHLKHHFAKHQDKLSYDALVKAAKVGSEDLSTVRESAVYSLAWLAKDQDWKTTQPEHYQETLPLIEGAITSPLTGTTVAGIRSAAVLDLKDHAPMLEAIAADEKQLLEIRIAAVQALGAIGRPESKPILDRCAQSPVKMMAQVASTALKQQGKQP